MMPNSNNNVGKQQHLTHALFSTAKHSSCFQKVHHLQDQLKECKNQHPKVISTSSIKLDLLSFQIIKAEKEKKKEYKNLAYFSHESP